MILQGADLIACLYSVLTCQPAGLFWHLQVLQLVQQLPEHVLQAALPLAGLVLHTQHCYSSCWYDQMPKYQT